MIIQRYIASLLFVLALSSPLAVVADKFYAEDLTAIQIRTGVSFSIPPWVIQETKSGIELEIFRKALAPYDYEIDPVFVPFARAFYLFESNKLDAVVNVKPGAVKNGYYSDPVVRFQNVAISLKTKNLPKEITISDLKKYRVVAFQNASKLLGSEFSEMTKNNDHYQEVAKQRSQINLLFLRNIDFIVMDKSIFGYYWNELYSEASRTGINLPAYLRSVEFHTVFPPSDYRFAFRNETVRDKFNLGLKQLIDSGEYEKIIEKYSRLSNLYQQ